MPFVALGAVVGGVLPATTVRAHPTVHQGSYHLAYDVGIRHGILVVGLYPVATCGAMLASGFRHVFRFGVSNLVAVAVPARLSADGFTSLWCFYAALASGAIARYLRIGDRRHAALPGVAGGAAA